MKIRSVGKIKKGSGKKPSYSKFIHLTSKGSPSFVVADEGVYYLKNRAVIIKPTKEKNYEVYVRNTYTGDEVFMVKYTSFAKAKEYGKWFAKKEGFQYIYSNKYGGE